MFSCTNHDLLSAGIDSRYLGMSAFNSTFTGIVTDILEIEQDVNNKDGLVGQVACNKEFKS